MEQQFEKEVVCIALTAGDDGVIRDTTFEACDIKGPAVIVLLDDVVMEHNRIDGDPDAVFWVIGPERPSVIGAVAIERCRFTGCHFMNVGIAGPADLIAQFTR